MERIACGDGVDVIGQAFEKGKQISCDRIKLKNLDMNNITGVFHGDGPGRIVSVRRGDSQNFAMPGGPFAGAGPVSTRTPVRPAGFVPVQPAADPDQMTCLDLRFMKSITGNKNSKELVFHGQVRAAHAPAQSWTTTLEDDDPKNLGKDAVVLHSEVLELADMSPVNGSSGGNMEFQALGNVSAEGTMRGDKADTPASFNALCARLSYSRAKDQLIFEGDGRSPAELYKQQREGGVVEPFKAQKIVVFQKSGQVSQINVDGIHSLEINPGPARPLPGR